MKSTINGSQFYSCDFCGKGQDEVERLLTGPKSVAICNRCVCLSTEVLLKLIKDSFVRASTVTEMPLSDKKSIPKGGY